MSTDQLTFIDLFAGIGGFRLGLERVGMRCVGGCEIDEHARKCYLSHFGGELHGDIRDYEGCECDLICGGFPCQDLSRARGDLRKGLNGERSRLFFEIIRLLERNKPRWVLLENVPGLLDFNRGRDFAIILDAMGKCGYGVSWRVLDSQYFGVPQQRRRIYIVGHFGGICPSQILFESGSGKGHPKKVRKKRSDIAYALTSSTGGVSGKEQQQTLIAKTISSRIGRVGDQELANLVPTVLPMKGGISPDRTKMLTVAKRMGIGGYIDDSVCSTIMARDWKDATDLILNCGVRRLTPLECERLQGFPDNWTVMLSDTQRYKCLGNAVTTYVIEWIGKRIFEANR